MGTLRAIIRASLCAVHLRVNNSSLGGVGVIWGSGSFAATISYGPEAPPYHSRVGGS
jgi:hypothetical protein